LLAFALVIFIVAELSAGAENGRVISADDVLAKIKAGEPVNFEDTAAALEKRIGRTLSGK